MTRTHLLYLFGLFGFASAAFAFCIACHALASLLVLALRMLSGAA